ncbi:ribonuclease MC-like [Actinidia eriantha]|uniref:ribonuclease MC-like n=1 Tax=Actinidia eriantha TaxID=165200 RepID=UPI002585C07D|nr:ribonuclease MC-like [Actinidia eriantha]
MTGPWPPSTCTPTSAYTQITVPNLFQRLKFSWPDVKNGNHQQFWEQEWNRHGEYSQLSYDQTAFFTLGVDLKDRHDIHGYFRSLNFNPGDFKSFKDIVSDIQSYTTKIPELACYSKGGYPLLQEIRICFDPWFAVIDCPIRSKSCVSTQQIEWVK